MSKDVKVEKVVQEPAPQQPARQVIEKRGGQTAPPNAPTPSVVTSVPTTSLVPAPAPAPAPSPGSESND
jgi:hypothetical protein